MKLDNTMKGAVEWLVRYKGYVQYNKKKTKALREGIS